MSLSTRKDASLNAQHQAILVAMQRQPENKQCADCHGPAPRWASTNLGCFLCIGCSGLHRKIGVHISVVRSVTLDTWTPQQVAHFRQLGNAKCALIYEAHLPDSFCRPSPSNPVQMERFIRDKYETLLFASKTDCAGEKPTFLRTQQRGENTSSTYQIAPNGKVYGRTSRDPPRTAQLQLNPGPERAQVSSFGTSRFPTAASEHLNLRTIRPTRSAAMERILDMGFSAQSAAEALRIASGNLEDAVDWLLQNDSHVRGASVRDPSKIQIPSDFSHNNTSGRQDSHSGTGPNNHVPAAARQSASRTHLRPSPDTAGQVNDESFEIDFADFGEFRSAFEEEINITDNFAPKENKVLQTSLNGKVPLEDQKITNRLASAGISLSDLYAKSCPTEITASSDHDCVRRRTSLTNSGRPLDEANHLSRSTQNTDCVANMESENTSQSERKQGKAGNRQTRPNDVTLDMRQDINSKRCTTPLDDNAFKSFDRQEASQGNKTLVEQLRTVKPVEKIERDPFADLALRVIYPSPAELHNIEVSSSGWRGTGTNSQNGSIKDTPLESPVGREQSDFARTSGAKTSKPKSLSPVTTEALHRQAVTQDTLNDSTFPLPSSQNKEIAADQTLASASIDDILGL